MTIEYRADGRPERLSELAADFVRRQGRWRDSDLGRAQACRDADLQQPIGRALTSSTSGCRLDLAPTR